MNIERTFEGWEARLRPRGWGRFFSAAFLVVWLCFWAAGEAAVLFFLGAGVWSLATGGPITQNGDAATLATALPMGFFLLAWLALWTVGGIAALHDLLRSLSAEDRLLVRSDGLEIIRRVGPFRMRRHVAQADLRGIYRVGSGTRLMAETRSGSLELTGFANASELARLEAELRRELRLDEGATGRHRAELPAGWEEATAPEGDRILIKHPSTRRKQAWFTWIVSSVAASGTCALLSGTGEHPSLAVLACIAIVMTVALAWGAAWLTWGRTEWQIGAGRLVQCRRFGTRVTPRFEANGLEFSATRDSDGDEWFKLEAVASGSSLPSPASRRESRRTIFNCLHDPTEPRRLGAWLAAQAEVPLQLPAGPERQAADIAALKTRLAATGRFGRWAAGLLDRGQTNRREP